MNSTPLIAHVIFKLDIGGLENGLVNLLNHMPRERYRHAIARVDSQPAAEGLVLVAVDETDFNLRGIGLRDAFQQRTLLHAVATPYTADHQHLHLTHEAAQQRR